MTSAATKEGDILLKAQRVMHGNFQWANHINRENIGASFTLTSKVLLSATVPSCCP